MHDFSALRFWRVPPLIPLLTQFAYVFAVGQLYVFTEGLQEVKTVP